MKSYGWLLATLIMAASASGVGAQEPRSVNIGGAGRDTCAAWSQDRGASSDTQVKERRVEWMLGFFSAVNFFNNQAGNLHGGIDDQNGMLAWIDNYCTSHPKDPVFVAAVDLVFDLRNNPRK